MKDLRNKNKDKKMEKAQRKGEKYSKTKNLHHIWQSLQNNVSYMLS
jgi:hypothetical protein